MGTYRVSDLRQAMADLSQDHSVYPLSVRENIGLGLPRCVSDIGMITEAARLGGALEFISKLKDGQETILKPVQTGYLGYRDDVGEHPLKEIFESLEKSVDISGMVYFRH